MKYRVEVLYGTVKLETRERREGSTLIGEGRTITTHDDGRVVVGEWEPSGCVMHVWDEWPEQPKRRGLMGFFDAIGRIVFA